MTANICKHNVFYINVKSLDVPEGLLTPTVHQCDI